MAYVKKSAKKKSKRPDIPVKKRKYVFKTKELNHEAVFEERPKARGPVKVVPVEEEGFTLFAVEKYDGPLYRSGFENTKEFQMLDTLLQNIKPQEQFIIRAEWERFAKDIIKGLDSVTRGGAKIVIRKIPDNKKFVKVARVS
jgi:hypothetical protein